MQFFIDQASKHSDRIAIKDNGREFTYRDLLNSSQSMAIQLLNGRKDLQEERIAFMVDPGYHYPVIQWGIWRAGGIAVPLCVKHPFESIRYVLEDTDCTTVVLSRKYEDLLAPLKDNKTRLIFTDQFINENGLLPEISTDRRAMILYTSGTTGKPKGVVTTHDTIYHQILSLTEAWAWSEDDHILNVLPLHHIHGIINVVGCALYNGACCEFISKFDEKVVFTRFAEGKINLFMAVPTIYYKLIAQWKELACEFQEQLGEKFSHFRLMVSGSAALPAKVMDQWKEISGHTLLERYGMTETGMALSNPYHGERRLGFVGTPLPYVKVRLVNEADTETKPGEAGEIQVTGPTVFTEYWNNSEATGKAFTSDGWFRTGDMAIIESGSYKILGRNSVDIIKSGGYKISALQIEEVLRMHPSVKDCAVVGIPDEEWGEIIAASIVPASSSFNMEQLQEWLKSKLPNYQLPRRYAVQQELSRNVLGKVTKNELKEFFISQKE